MKYIEAYELMKDGSAVSRAAWDYVTADGVKDEKFNVMFKDVNYIMSFRYHPNPQFGNYIPLLEDLEANDWYVKNTNWKQPVSVEAVVEAAPEVAVSEAV
jgi:hypothetical protein